jgi:MoaA/NifB/PqqE/SkfB family radical SAM enzyme
VKQIYPTSASFAVTLRCNSRCLHCDIWRRKTKREISPAIYRKLPPTLKSIDVTGGEPFLRDDLVEIVGALKQACPRARILITTNGLLSKKINQMTKKILHLDKNIAFRVSLDGMGKVHDKIRGAPQAFEKANKTIKALKKLKVKDLGIIFTLTKLNQNEMPRILDFCKKEKLNFSLNLVHESPIYFGVKKMNLRPRPAEISGRLEKTAWFFIPSFNPKNWAKAWFYRGLVSYTQTGKRPIKCGAGENFFYLDPFGDVYLCHLKNWKIGNLKKQSFSQIWQGAERKKYLKMAKTCHDCWMICTARDEIKKIKWRILKKRLSLFK